MVRAEYETELSALGRKLADAQARIDVIRPQLDERLLHWHQEGVTITTLAGVTGLSRVTVAKSIERARAASQETKPAGRHRRRRPPTGSSSTSLPGSRRR